MARWREWLLSVRTPLAVASILLSLYLYNCFALASDLQNLKTAVSLLNAAGEIRQAETALLFLDQALVAEAAREEVDLRKLTILQYAQGSLTAGENQRPVQDVQVMLAPVLEEAAARRSTFLTALDGVSSGARGLLLQARLLLKQIAPDPTSRRMNHTLLNETFQLEREGKLAEALEGYEELLEDYPNYSGGPLLKLRLGYLFQRMGRLERAQRLYQEALGDARRVPEAQAAQRMLDSLNSVKRREWDAKLLEQRLSDVGRGSELQQAAYQFGSLLIGLSQSGKAAKIFRQAREAAPNGKLALPSLFKEGWCLQRNGKSEEALERFQEVIRRDAGGPWSAASHQQIAEMYKTSRDFASAARTYEKILVETKDSALAAIVHAQLGATYRYDLKQSGESTAYFHELQSKFPASPFSTMEQKLIREEKAKAAAQRGTAQSFVLGASPAGEAPTPGFAEGSPLMNWLEGFLPAFVDVFADRAARFMEAARETELKRQFTEQEFRDLVVRRVQERYESQVTEVDAQIRPSGLVGKGKVQLGGLQFNVTAHVEALPREGRIHLRIREIVVGAFSMPEPLLKVLERRVNASIDRARYPVRIKECELRDGYAYVALELTKRGGAAEPREQVLFR